MLRPLKNLIKQSLRYVPLAESQEIRDAIDAVKTANLPYCPSYMGDLLFSLIRTHGFTKCLEIGFHTGSTALYMADAVAPQNGTVTSICVDDDEGVKRGLDLLRGAGHDGHHLLIRQNSSKALPELFMGGARYDFVLMDGWKTFDHLAFEIFYLNQMLDRGGVIAFDDTHMPSVRRAIRLLQSHYGYREVDYAQHNQDIRLHLFLFLTRRSWHRPYRAFEKTLDTKDQLPFQDWNFYKSF